MGTEVLRPQDCLIERIRQPPVSINHCNHRKNHAPNPSRSTRKPAKRPDRSDKRRGLPIPIPIPATRRSSSDDMRMARSSSGIMREKVTILRRGESLDSKIMSEALLAMKKKQGDDDDLSPIPSIYAGSAFAVSPSPSALPIPSFSKKPPSVAVDDSATRDLRRLLRLE